MAKLKILTKEEKLMRSLRFNFAKFDRLCSLRENNKITAWDFSVKARPILERGKMLRSMLGYADNIVGTRSRHNKTTRKELRRIRRCKTGRGCSARSAKR